MKKVINFNLKNMTNSGSAETGAWERFIDAVTDYVKKNPQAGEKILQSLLPVIYKSGVVQQDPQKYPLLSRLFNEADKMIGIQPTDQQTSPPKSPPQTPSK